MKKNSLLFSVAVALLCVSVFSTMAFAGGKKLPGPNTQGVVVAQAVDAPASVKHVLKGIYVNSGQPGLVLAANTFTVLDPAVAVVCPGAAGNCTVLVDAFATSGSSNAVGNRALCVTLNGSIVGSCPYSGPVAADGSYSQIANNEVAITIPHGTSTMQTLVYSQVPTTVFTYTVKYNVAKP